MSNVDVNVWRAIVGTAVKIPAVNTYVYYFPQGHLEQSSSTSISDDPVNYNFTLQRPWIPCQVLSVAFLAKYSSDQPYIKMLLQPLGPRRSYNGGCDSNDDDDGVVSFVKILTPSDTNNGGGLSVPRYCAEMILPQLDYTGESTPPAQTLVMRDAHNTTWEFRHLFRGLPRRHVLTTGWNSFANAKRLVAGDSVVFVKKRLTNELFIGIRRAQRSCIGSGNERLEAMVAMATAARGRPFEVVYYPGVGVPEFVVEAEKAKEAICRRWTAGMRVRMALETDDNTSPLTWIRGVVAAVMMPNRGMWYGSPWRVLQVNWEDPETTQHVRRVSPWQVECITLITPPIDPDYRPSKRLRTLQDSIQGRTFPLHTMELTGQQSSLSSIQGARRLIVNELQKLRPVGRSHPGILVPANHNTTVHELNAGSSSFQLFGKTIEVSTTHDGSTSHDRNF